MTRLFVALVALALAPAADAQDAAAFARDADALLAAAVDALSPVPGLALAVVRDGETAYAGGAGWADAEAGVAFTAETPFYIASATKPFTALLTALLDRDGALDLDASLADLFPDVAFDPAIGAEAVTVRDLLAHTSGLDNGALAFRAAYSGEHTPADMRRLLAQTGTNADAPHGTFAYTNLGYNILSLHLDGLGGGPWQDLLSDRVFAPLGLTRTTAYASEAADWRPAVPYAVTPDAGYERVALVKHDDTMQAAGGMIASAADLARWLTLHLEGGRLDGRQLVPADVIAELHQPVATGRDDRFGPFGRDGYALGWHTGTYDGDAMLHHFGGFPGFHTHTSFLPERRLGVVVLVNESTVGGRLAPLVASFAYDWWRAAPDDRDAITTRTAEALGTLREQMTGALEGFARSLAERDARTWQLSLAPAAYAGTYVDDAYGTLVVEATADELSARIGRLHAVATPFPEPEAVRVELVPGSGQVLTFRLDGDRPDAVLWSGRTFERVD